MTYTECTNIVSTQYSGLISGPGSQNANPGSLNCVPFL